MSEKNEECKDDELKIDKSLEGDDDVNTEYDDNSEQIESGSPLVRYYNQMQRAHRPQVSWINDYVSTLSQGVIQSAWSALQTKKITTNQINNLVSDSALFENAGLNNVMRAQIASTNILNFDRLALHIGKNLDLNFSTSVFDNIASFARTQNDWLKSLTPATKRAAEAHYPENIKGLEGLRFDDVEVVVMKDGIAMYGVPDRKRAASLLKADSPQKRRAYLGDHWQELAQDCRQAVENCSALEVMSYKPFVYAALDALESENPQAAQALAASIIDSLITDYFGKDNKGKYYKPDGDGKRTTDSYYNDFAPRKMIAMAPMWSAYQIWRPHKDEPVPRTFSRHATAHTVSTQQYSRRNAVQALLFASSLLLWWNDEATIDAA